MRTRVPVVGLDSTVSGPRVLGLVGDKAPRRDKSPGGCDHVTVGTLPGFVIFRSVSCRHVTIFSPSGAASG